MTASCSVKEEQVQKVSVLKPEDNRFTPVILTPEGALDEPMMFEVADENSVFIIERKGALKRFDLKTRTMNLITTLDVFTGNEQGLIGLTLDPNFQTNHWIYLQYAPAKENVFKLVRWEVSNDKLVEGSEKVVLTIPVDRENTNHTGGGMTWDKNGNLYLTVGNNTGNRLTAQTDERPGFSYLDDQRGASNTNDLRGKILRIHPEPDGSYSIPKGNLFPENTAKTRPEIYTMGHRNVWRVSVDSKTGWIYWGEVGPDQDTDSETGPRGYDEQNQAKGPGFFGWPYFIADNQAIPKYDFANDRVGEKLDPTRPVNTSPNNTGLKELPPAQPALIYYPYATSDKFPLVGSSSRCAIGGPIYHRSDFKNPQRPFPEYYEGKWLMGDYSRFWIMAVTLDDDGNYVSMERFAPDYHPVQPLDIKFGPSGDLYVLEYGSNTVRSAAESRLVRVEYNAGNRKPVVQASASKRGGAVPFTITLSSKGTVDYDNDELKYEWKISGDNNSTMNEKGESPVITLTDPGVYTATLTVTDGKGESGSATVRLIAGNEPPVVVLRSEGNKTFFFPETTFEYDVKVSDKEDGTLGNGIDNNAVVVSFDYTSEGFDFAPIQLGHADLDAASRDVVAQSMIRSSDCRNCHTVDVKAVGPAFKQIAEKYNGLPGSKDTLAQRIIKGSSGLWGTDNNMPAHPNMSVTDARTIANYILNINNPKPSSLPVKGKYSLKVPSDDNGRGTYIFRAAYTDRGAGSIPPQTTDTIVLLKSPKLNPVKAEIIEGGALRDQLDEYIFLTAKPDAYIGYKAVDLTTVKQISFHPNWHLYDIYPGGKVEVRIDKPDGELIGEAAFEPEQFNTRYRGLFDGLKNPSAEQQKRMKRYPALDPSRFFARGSDKNSFTIPSETIIKETNGVHDLYFVFRNFKPGKADALFPLAEIVLMNSTSKKK
ncbi:PQQ-dependent sugar dehydrogenase [Chryseolinea sp. H1M3-3]|uniref:PQQ-dependent sugar dehydrogenase n=1 Tax=Chryseolinea sp. H1M3-3 TaxID=3034144 RepID=UPI0023EC04EF|nr:PQQ-dependent sugar dehydrogenase [Chryseolinea sp. H1M3-3]